MSYNEFFLPGVTRWNGIPYLQFRRVWYVALTVALGTISQDSYTLLQTARNQDLGSPGNPGTPAQTTQSQNRNQRVFACIMNYIEPTCSLYREIHATFANNGRGLFTFLYEVGHLAMSRDIRERLQNEWEESTISRAGITYDKNALFKWFEYLKDLGDRIGKTTRELRSKYLDGFPESFDVLVVPERLRGLINDLLQFPGELPCISPCNAGKTSPEC